jgi:hypothetical protein
MLLHLEKAHDLPADSLEFVRRVDPADHRAVWMTVNNRNANQTLVEIDVVLDSEMGSTKTKVIESDSAVSNQKQVREASWTPAALQSLYRARGGRQPA